jgi:hypothetical protein
MKNVNRLILSCGIVEVVAGLIFTAVAAVYRNSQILPIGLFIILTAIPQVPIAVRVLIPSSLHLIASAVIVSAELCYILATLWLLCIGLIFIVVAAIYLIKALIHLLRKNKKTMYEGIVLFSLIICSLMLSREIVLSKRLYFYWRLNGYQSVIELIKSEQIKPDSLRFAKLPTDQRYLSFYPNGAQVFKEGTNLSVWFFEVADSGYLYSTIGEPPEWFKGKCKKLDYEKSWFYCHHPYP